MMALSCQIIKLQYILINDCNWILLSAVNKSIVYLASMLLRERRGFNYIEYI